MAGFVGTSNLLNGEAARAVIGEDGVFTIRPEKIRLAGPGRAARAGRGTALGTIREVVYIGSDTRYIVALDVGGELVVTQQNLQTSSMEALAAQGRPVRLDLEAPPRAEPRDERGTEGARRKRRPMRHMRIPPSWSCSALLLAACSVSGAERHARRSSARERASST